MKKIILSLVFLFILVAQNPVIGQGSWSAGTGFSNFAMHGDLRSYRNVRDIQNYINPGVFVFVDKMINPAFGFEAKFNFQKMSGGAFELSDPYPVTGTNVPLGNTRFEGSAYGGELLAIINMSGLHADYGRDRKWNWGLTAGIGFHYYDSKLYNADTGDLLINYGNSPSSNHNTESMYYTAGINLKYFLSNNFSLELRQDVNLNEEDHLDAAASTKQTLDIFFRTGIGLVFHLNKKNIRPMVWGGDGSGGIEPTDEMGDGSEMQKKNSLFTDSDGDGVMDKFDKDPHTPAGVLVYGNGTPVDTDRDGVPDYKDDCPLKYALTTNGCPGDYDKDGVADMDDQCPETPGTVANKGCPEEKTSPGTELVKVYSIFFDWDSDYLKHEYADIITEVYLKTINDKSIRIQLEGFADSIGDEEYNMELSGKRVQSIKEALVKVGVDPQKISTKAYGASKTTFVEPKYRSYNRRVDIILEK